MAGSEMIDVPDVIDMAPNRVGHGATGGPLGAGFRSPR